MTDGVDVESYLNGCNLRNNVLDALDCLFHQQFLPYNPYKSLICSFNGASESFVMTKSHLTSDKLPLTSTTKSGSLVKSTGIPVVWGLESVIPWINCTGITHALKAAESLIEFPENVKLAVSFVYPSVFHQSLLGYVLNEINIHIDVVITGDDVDNVLNEFIELAVGDFLQNPEILVPLQFKIAGAVSREFKASEVVECQDDLRGCMETATQVVSTAMLREDGSLTKVTKTYTLFRLWKKMGKLFCSSYGTVPLLNLYQGALINHDSAEVYESILFQSTLVDQEAAHTKKSKHQGASRGTTMYLSKHHPSVVPPIMAIRDGYLSTSHSLDLYRFVHGLILDCFIDPVAGSEALMEDISRLHKSSSGKLNCLASRYEALAKYVAITTESHGKVADLLRTSLKDISKRLDNISSHSMYSHVTKHFSISLENNIFVLEELLHREDQAQNIATFLDVEKITCMVGSLYLQPFALSSLTHLTDIVNAYSDNLSVIRNHLSRDLSHITSSPHDQVPVPKYEIGFYEPGVFKSFTFGVDVEQNAAKIQSAANMHTIAVLLQYQSDMFIDMTIENSMTAITTDFPSNPYNYLIQNCLSSFYKVEHDIISESSLTKSLIQKPRLKNQENQIFCINEGIFGLYHTLLQGDSNGMLLLLNVCKTAQNKPYITKKDGIRIMHAMYPCAEQITCGKLNPMMYTFNCEEVYVMIKESRSAGADTGLDFLTEMLVLHLIDISMHHIVVGYSVDKGDTVLLNMDRVQSNMSEKDNLTSEILNALRSRAQLTFEFFIKLSLGYYVKVVKDIKPIYADPSVELYDHYTPSVPLNSNFAVFYKHYTATFFYDYAEGTGEEDVQFVISRLNQKILEEKDTWHVYKTIMLKHMLLQDTSFLVTAFHAAHSACSKLHGLQQLNGMISELIDKSLTGSNKNLDESIVKDMVVDLVSHCKETLQHICISDPLIKYINAYLSAIYRSGDIVLDDSLGKLLNSLFVLISSLVQYFEKEYLKSSGYKFDKFIAEAASQI